MSDDPYTYPAPLRQQQWVTSFRNQLRDPHQLGKSSISGGLEPHETLPFPYRFATTKKTYPLVNVYILPWKITIFHGKNMEKPL